MKLELKHFAPYLPYELKYKDIPEGYTKERTLDIHTIDWALNHGKLILRPMEDIFKEEFYYKLQNQDDLYEIEDAIKNDTVLYLGYDLILFLVSNHFDIFGLIEEGLAIDINSL